MPHRGASSHCRHPLLRLRRDTSGAILMSGLMIMAALMILGVAAMHSTTIEHTISGNHRTATQARYAAEAGAVHVMSKYKATVESLPNAVQLADLALPTQKPEQANLGGQFAYWIESLTYEVANPPTYVDIESMGTVMGSKARARVVARLPYSPPPIIDYGLFADTNVHMGGTSLIDSYNAREGPYDPTNPGTNGNIGTNGTGTDSIYVESTGAVFGDVSVGMDGDPVMDMTVKGELSGTQTALAEPKDLPAMVDPGGGTEATLDINGGTQTFSDGNYRLPYASLGGGAVAEISGNVTLYIDGDMKIEGSANLVVTPGSQLTIYVSGDVDIGGGGIINESEMPKNLTIYGTSTTQQIKVHGNADFYGTIYAPTADITVTGTSDLYGAVIGDVLDLTSRVHYDECLTQPGRAGSDIVLRVVSWRIG